MQHAVRKIQGQDTVNMGQEKLQLVISIKVVWTERKKRKEEIKEHKYNKAFYISVPKVQDKGSFELV